VIQNPIHLQQYMNPSLEIIMQITQIDTKETCIKHKKSTTRKHMCFRISNHQKWFEIIQLEIMSHTLNILNYIHIGTGSKLTYPSLLIIIKL